ncbi:PREDICTED: glycosylated lysosomal membrane protein A-like [Trachymyrmex cornetzi]|uniref:glycosylated lysosomal membrane protein A-like n=1 Tax=Trachymyrmex cornetzi TaxID=471704 RepID=UPI00084F2F94|nr:PREDICTED: glycosylated lysosomal membrane protein A-like [Trachymyrmex cornetzi]
MASALTFCLLLVATLADSVFSTQRTLRSWVNQGCGEPCRERNVTTLYLRADGPNDTLHYLWDFIGTPSVLLAVTPPSAYLNITWDDYLARRENSVVFSEKPSYSFGVIINKIIEFNDVNDTALIDTADVTNTNVLHSEYFNWRLVSLLQNSEFVSLDMEGNSYHDTAKNISRYGSIKLSLRGFCTVDHSDMVPHMLHTENSTQVDIILDHIQTNQTFVHSRFAIELLAVGGGNPEVLMFVDPKKSLDDEHTPGIFEVVEVRTPPYSEQDGALNAGSYLQWRPVSYISASRDVTSSTETVQYPPKQVFNYTSIKNSMLYCYYGDGETMNLLLQKIMVSLGSKGDGFYKKTNYLTWTFMIGYGTPPEERFSSLVIMIISIGLGLPLLIMVITGLYLCIRRMPKRHGNAYLNR